MTSVLTLLGAVLITAVASELLGWTPVLARTIVRHVVQRLPEKHRDRYREEWLAEIDSICKSGRYFSLLFWLLGLLTTASTTSRQLSAHSHRNRERPFYLLFAFLYTSVVLYFFPQIMSATYYVWNFLGSLPTSLHLFALISNIISILFCFYKLLRQRTSSGPDNSSGTTTRGTLPKSSARS